MEQWDTEPIARACPPFRWPLLGWLTAPLGAQSADVAEKLRATLFSRLISIVSSAILVFATAVAIAVSFPSRAMTVWVSLDGVLLVVRLLLVGVIIRYRRRNPSLAAPPGPMPELYLVVSLLWCAMLGYGGLVCLMTGQAAVGVMAGLLVMATIGGQCARAFGTPRAVVLQILLILLPFVMGAGLAPDPFMRWVLVVMPGYLFGMITVNRQLHRDYVDMIVARQQSRRQAMRCGLTDLANRRMFDRSLSAAVATMRAGEQDVFVMCLDLDGFKTVNDAHGHPAGDCLLRQVAKRLLREVPPGNISARLGGDEFGIILRAQSHTNVVQLADAILDGMRQPFVLDGDRSVWVGISIGIACAAGSTSPEAAFGEADQALYAAKRAGKNTYRWFGQTEAPAGASQSPRAA